MNNNPGNGGGVIMETLGKRWFTFIFLLIAGMAYGQNYQISGVISATNRVPISRVELHLQNTAYVAFSDSNGQYTLQNIPPGKYLLVASAPGFESIYTKVELSNFAVQLDLVLNLSIHQMEEVEITSRTQKKISFNDVEGFTIYESKKGELIQLNKVTANLATNNARQVFARVPGLNVWESDGAGLQLGIGARGLSPSRSANFNTRQNGYDISADAIGYPESYYTPPMEAVEKIELLRGAASLQFGSQFGGLLNFVMKKGHATKRLELITKQTIGSYGIFNSFNSLGGTLKKWNYLACYQYKVGEGYRQNSSFHHHTAFGTMSYRHSDKLTLGFEYTFMNYLAQQPGGLTDAAFIKDPRQSSRSRNWFAVNWNVFSLNFNYAFSPRTKVNLKNFALSSARKSLGNLDPINRVDDPSNFRSLIQDNYTNVGSEVRVLHTYLISELPATLVAGARAYLGQTLSGQGNADKTAEPNFNFVRPEYLESYKYKYPGKNAAFFIENIFRPGSKLSFTPGVRVEYIATYASGYYNLTQTNAQGQVVAEKINEEKLSNSRTILLTGFGGSYKPKISWEIYGNISQNYRAVTFTDMRIQNRNQKIDPDLKDEKGYNSDLGAKGRVGNCIMFDASLFYLYYNRRIGTILQQEPVTYVEYAYRTNIGNSGTYGAEMYAEMDFMKLWKTNPESHLTLFANLSVMEGIYLQPASKDIYKNKVEFTPPIQSRLGINMTHKKLKFSCQYSYTASQFTDALNTVQYSNAIIGIIPSYFVMDATAAYKWKNLEISATVNNLTNHSYFTRRAASYPGPGIIPSDGRSLYVTLGFQL